MNEVCPTCRDSESGWSGRIHQNPDYAILRAVRYGPRGNVELMVIPSANQSGDHHLRFLWSIHDKHYMYGISKLYHLPFPDQGIASSQKEAMRKAEETYKRFIAIEEPTRVETRLRQKVTESEGVEDINSRNE